MATTAHLDRFPANMNGHAMPSAPTRRSSSSREPRVRSILLSGNALTRPPVVHAHSGSEPAPNSRNVPFPSTDVHTSTPPALSPSSSPDAASEVAPEREGRPPSIHLSETVSTTIDQPRPPNSISEAEPDPSAQPDMPPPPVSAMRTRRMTLDLPSSPIEVLYESDHKLALEGTSPKPCIVPGNALHLIDDDPAAPRSATPPSLIVVGDESEHGVEVETDMDADIDGEEDDGERSASQPPPSSAARPTPRVRFRSRVRITSGVHRHRHSMSAAGGSTPGSSTSDSPSSSISAPLRYQADENAPWGPIGKRLSQYAAAGGWQRRVHTGQGQGADANGGQGVGARGGRGARGYTERTPLLRPPPGRHVYSESEDDDTGSMGESERTARAAALRREEEVVFGKWPWRFFNRHWWWWHVEPVLCCCCADDSDYEEF
ncbi:hypothetical protein L226DRAFT_538610 [Lentinus tigrinus ALCF2SS1-7]|uniref:uncharacterized protein n=1 Tax=Lentinus tigrinus ALCF2SS1-7 TaxID=1328758 RepID=UPI001165CF10|nr:hypothetical protein L226DRAFT_538610 [Lentinus tigrinus ALCF2SS1-7]